ncbi:branched-chain amino acid ABC transporter permease [Pseudoclavibacter sp. RFBA6]|uniref:branched-chain amino acid ABC transporter permease n=1 Tax=Pseudoclavibacter sp. RFBA6 TaxID=2080573 RepID=UPI0015E22EB7|nr:branched-chain amino acid ABC transporter permease [Pseudoclavibacter sp. RFBA6]
MADALIAILVSAVVLGSLYALLASGLSIVWSTLGVFNYAQGGILIAAGYLIWTLAGPLGVPVLLAFILAVPLVALLGVVLELVAVRPLVHRANGTLLVMVSTLAVASAMGGAMQLIWGPTNRQLPAVSTETVSIGGTQVAVTSLLALALALSLVIGLIQLLNRTEWGAGIRAVAQNRDMALLMGIKPSRVYATVFGIAAVLACAAALIYGTTSTLTPTKGFEPLLTAFVVLVFGGSATLWGTLLGAFVIGLLEAATSFALGLQWSPVIVFVVLVAVLLIRPQGLVKGRTA